MLRSRCTHTVGRGVSKLAVAACAAIAAQSASAGTYLTTYARSGQMATGTPANWSGLASSSTNPFLEDLNRVAFGAQLTGTGVTGANDFAIWAGDRGALSLVAREGSSAPGVGTGVNYASFNDAPLINAAGDVAYRATLTGTGVTFANDLALYAGPAAGAPTLVARTGDLAPGAFLPFAGIGPTTFGNGGYVAFLGSIETVPPGVGSNGIWTGLPGGIGLAAIELGAVPGSPAGTFYGQFFGPVLVNTGGNIAFRAHISGPGIGGANNLVLLYGAPGAEAVVAREGNAAPGLGAAVYIGLEEPVITDGAKIAYRGTVSGGGTTFANDVGIWAGPVGAPVLLVREGDVAVGTPAGVTIGDLSGLSSSGRPSLNDGGRIAFRANLAGAGVTGANDGAIYSGTALGMSLVAREGSQAAGAALGSNFGTFGSTGPALNQDDQVAFAATLTGTPFGRDTGVWMTSVDGTLVSVACSGDIMKLDDGTFRVLTSLTQPVVGFGGQDGRGSSINNDSRVMIRASFTSGQSALIAGGPPAEWGVDAPGDWSNPLNWRGGVPGVGGGPDEANFRGFVTLSRTVNVDGLFTLDTLSLNDDNSYTLADDMVTGHGIRMLNGTNNTSLVVSQGAHTIGTTIRFDGPGNDIAIHNTSSLNFSGVVSIGSGSALTKVGLGQTLASGTVNFNGGIDYRVGANVVDNNGNMNFNLTSDATGPGVPNFAIAGGATLNASGIGDPFTNGALLHATISNNGVFNVLANTKHVASIDGTGTTGVSPFATLEVGSEGPVTQSNFNVNGIANVGSVNVANIVGVGNGTMAASLSAQYIRSGALAIQTFGIASAKLNGTIDATSRIGSLTITGGPVTPSGTLDLSNNDLVYDYTTVSPATDVTNLIKAGYAGGIWNGTGITSSAAAAAASSSMRTAMGIAEASELFSTFPATFSGQSVDNTTILVRYTLSGDANLDRTVNITDFAILAANFNNTSLWSKGDFNYDGVTGIGDFAALAANFNRALPVASALPRGAAVPEPGAVALGLALLPALARRAV